MLRPRKSRSFWRWPEHVAAAVRVERVVALGRAHHRVALAGLGAGEALDVGDLALGAEQAVFLEADHVGQVLEFIDHAQVLEERLDLRQRDAGDRRLRARAFLHRDAVQVGQRDHVARIDQVRVGDLRVGLPDLRPQPRALEELAGDIPQRVAPLHHIGVGVVAAHLGGDGVRGNGEQRSGQDRADRIHHGGHLPVFPLQVRSPGSVPVRWSRGSAQL